MSPSQEFRFSPNSYPIKRNADCGNTFACVNIAVPLWTRMFARAYCVLSSATSTSLIRLFAADRFSFKMFTAWSVRFKRRMFAPSFARMSAKFWIDVWMFFNAVSALAEVVIDDVAEL